jgi:hypothetical protein
MTDQPGPWALEQTLAVDFSEAGHADDAAPGIRGCHGDALQDGHPVSRPQLLRMADVRRW